MADHASYDDAVQAMNHIGSWVNNADTKIGLLAAALTVLTGGIVRQRSRFETLVTHDPGPQGWTAVVFLAVSAGALFVAAAWLFRALMPRLTNDQPSRFAFPHLAGAELDTLVAHDPAVVRRDAWTQAQTLSKIVLDKYCCFRHALSFGLVAGACFVGWLLIVPAG